MHFAREWIILFSCILAFAQDDNWNVGRIQFNGNEKLTSEQLLKQMKLQPPTLFKKTEYSLTALADDINVLEQYYKLNGFLNAKVEIGEIIHVNKYHSVVIEIQIYEGVQTFIDSIIIAHSTVISDDSLLSIIPVKLKEPYDSIKIAMSEQVIKDTLASMGHLFSKINIEKRIGSTQKTAKLIYFIEAGPMVRAGNLKIFGVEKVKEQVITRRVTMEPGILLTSYQINSNTAELYNTGLFDLVNIEPQDTATDYKGQKEITVPVVIRVSESAMLEFISGGGYSTEDGLYGNLSFLYRNLFRLGHSISLSTRASIDLLYAEAIYTYPNIFNTSVNTSITGYIEKQDEPIFSGSFTGGIIGLNGRIGRASIYNTYLRTERILSIDRASDPDTITGDQPRNIFLIGAAVTRESRWAELNSRSSYTTFIDVEVAGLNIIRWSSNYFKLRGDFRWNAILGARIILSSALFAGFATGFAGDDVPVQEQFYFGSGGIREIRGYSEEELTITGPGGRAIGADFALVFTPLELTFPLISIIRGAVFIEGGNVWKDINTFRLSSIKWAAGPGIRIGTPLGPLRVDYGIQLDSHLPLDGRFSFGIGVPF